MISEPAHLQHQPATAVGKAMKAIEIRANLNPVSRALLLAMS
jgi:hypothetical protein